MAQDVFVSFSAQENRKAGAVATEFATRGVCCWLSVFDGNQEVSQCRVITPFRIDNHCLQEKLSFYTPTSSWLYSLQPWSSSYIGLFNGGI